MIIQAVSGSALLGSPQEMQALMGVGAVDSPCLHRYSALGGERNRQGAWRVTEQVLLGPRV